MNVSLASVDVSAAPFSITAGHYIDNMLSVPGWFHREDAEMLHAVLLAQESLGVKGDLCEIGVYCGKSLALLGIMACEGERVHGYDLFTEPADALARTRELLRVVGVDHVCELHAGDSLSCTVPACRVLHVDGSHDFVVALADMYQAAALVPHGVLVVDDFCDSAFPSVAKAVGALVQDSPFRPFACSRNKLFLARYHDTRRLQERIPERGFVGPFGAG